ncbi:cyclophilin-like fold protein [Xanthomonas sp. NCPPB 2654]|uniref:cyclophilin-like fold protein n=1 Tax=unclassified Xanthomonas TaxID=2643310 RepID=UPI0021E04FF7|nr:MULTISPECIES: cyclophilin-like fold protein [unclassified Xanthomonas]MDL5365113.1 cyclophilin-like fold protein [Xanthomonas sp. NCPPB 2654]UYC21536.1 cyclophilin-like fold protein [Xanthomonas sp. CFBP 8443]
MHLKLRSLIEQRALARWWPLCEAVALLGMVTLAGCAANPSEALGTMAQDARGASAKWEGTHMWMTVGERRFAVTLADTSAARAFAAQLPLALDMAELNGNEKHADLAKALPVRASRPGTIQKGDLMLYGTRTVVVFYESFHSSYTYTSLGRVDDPAGLAQALGRGDVRVAFSAE